MKNLITIALFLFSFSLFAQNNKYPEPEFIGESFILSGDSAINLEKETIKIKTKAGATVYIFGIGNVKSRVEIEKCCSNARTDTKTNLQIVVRAVDNNTDPLSIISIFKFEQGKKSRKAEMSSLGTFSGSSENNMQYVKFKGKRYGDYSYVLTIPNIEAGDEKNTIVSTFGVD